MARRKIKPKTERKGFALRVYMLDGNGEYSWQRVGFLFLTKLEAEQYRERHYPKVARFTVQGVRVNIEPIVVPTAKDEMEGGRHATR